MKIFHSSQKLSRIVYFDYSASYWYISNKKRMINGFPMILNRGKIKNPKYYSGAIYAEAAILTLLFHIILVLLFSKSETDTESKKSYGNRLSFLNQKKTDKYLAEKIFYSKSGIYAKPHRSLSLFNDGGNVNDKITLPNIDLDIFSNLENSNLKEFRIAKAEEDDLTVLEKSNIFLIEKNQMGIPESSNKYPRIIDSEGKLIAALKLNKDLSNEIQNITFPTVLQIKQDEDFPIIRVIASCGSAKLDRFAELYLARKYSGFLKKSGENKNKFLFFCHWNENNLRKFKSD